MRQQPIPKPEEVHRPTILDTRTRHSSNTPIRTINYVEVGGMERERVAELAQRFAAEYQNNTAGPHYFIPVRGGKLTNDIAFEAEVLPVIRELCTIQDGKIVLKDGAVTVDVIRNFIGG